MNTSHQSISPRKKPSNESGRTFSLLGGRLNEANTIRRVAEIIVEAADELMGWDACALDLYFPESATTRYVLAMDLVEGRRVETAADAQTGVPSPKFRQVMKDGAQMILRGAPEEATPECVPFGDKARRSASLLFVPIRYQQRITGILTVQKYTTYAYTEGDLLTLQALADHGAGAIERIRAEAPITDRKAVEQSLHRERTMLRALVDILPDSVYVKDTAGRKILANPADVRNAGCQTEAEVIGKSDFDLFPRETAEAFVADDQVVLRAGRPVLDREESFVDAQGAKHWLLTSKMPLRDEQGQVTGLIGIGRDITQRKRADEALRQSESQFRLVWDNSEDGMRLTNREGVMLRVNDAFCRMVQKPRRELEGQLLTVVHTAGNADFVLSSYQRRVDTKTLEPRLETEVTLWNGREVWFELSNSLLKTLGPEPLVLCIFREVTQRKQAAAELELLHRQLLDVSRQAGMAEVATSVLHNVGNVLNSVNVSGSLITDKVRHSKIANLVKATELLRTHEADLPAFLADDAKGRQLPDYLFGLAQHLSTEQGEILKELKSLASNIDHIKEIVAMQQNYAKVLGVLESLPVADLVEDALRLNSGAMERHHVSVVREYSEVPPILVDKHKVLQILVNLIRNSKYALDDRGHSDKRLTLRVGLNGNNTVKIAVMDNGIGIRAEHLTRIFEHGFTTRKEGHGFGLHNGALAAKDLGGSLTAHSDGPGQGATFTLELPLCPKDKGHDTRLHKKPLSATPEHSSARVLVAAGR